MNVAKRVIHPRWTHSNWNKFNHTELKNFDYDIALFKNSFNFLHFLKPLWNIGTFESYDIICKSLKLNRLSQPVNVDSYYVKIVPLPRDCAPTGQNCKISGWGALSYMGSSPSTLQATDSH